MDNVFLHNFSPAHTLITCRLWKLNTCNIPEDDFVAANSRFNEEKGFTWTGLQLTPFSTWSWSYHVATCPTIPRQPHAGDSCALLGCYITSSGNYLPTFRVNSPDELSYLLLRGGSLKSRKLHIAPLILNLATKWFWVISFTFRQLYPSYPLSKRTQWNLQVVLTFWGKGKKKCFTRI